MEFNKGKDFEQPDAGMYLGTIIDVVDMPECKTQWGIKNKVRILWTLTHVDNTPVLDKEGKPMTVAYIKPASVHEKADLYKMLTMILNAAPPLMNGSEDLAKLLLGRSNVLFVTLTPNEKQPGKFYANVTGVAPLGPGQIPPPIPQGFVRDVYKAKTVAGVQTYATPQAAAAVQAQSQPTHQAQTQQPGPPPPTQPATAPVANNVAF